MKRLKDEGGITLINALVASLILFLGLLAVGGLFLAAIISTYTAQRMVIANTLAEDKMEEFRTLGYDSLRTLIAADQTTGEDTVQGVIRRWTLSLLPDGVIQVRISVTYRGARPGVRRTVEFVSYITRHG